MEDGFHVRIDQLGEHARTVEDLARQAGVAVGAGQQVAGMDDAYGFFCRPIAWILEGPQRRCADSLARCAHALRRIASDLDATAEAYERTDVTAAGRLGRIGPHR